MQLSSLHLLLTYQCTLECDHCFVWGSPWQTGTMTLAEIRYLLEQAQSLGSVESIYFEGGEPFLFYPLMLAGVRQAAQSGFQVGIVSNGYWATSLSDALVWLEPLAGLITDLSISSDLYHWSEPLSQQAGTARAAAEQLGIPVGLISVAQPPGAEPSAQPESSEAQAQVGQLPIGESGVMYRGRAAEKLAHRAPQHPWDGFIECPHEDLREPGRVHVDPFGNLHLCQGLVIGNLFQTPLKVICDNYDPESHPIVGPLLHGGPAELARRYSLTHRLAYADACQMCDAARRALRVRFPAQLGPSQMYGVGG
jgi:MoaA/NifB/PqqE/SkfB family radical SAM enzyme